MVTSVFKRLIPIPGLFFLLLAVTSCGLDLVPVPTLTPTQIPTATATPIPLAFSVNGEGVTLAAFTAELTRYQQAQGNLGNSVSVETATQMVTNDMIEMLLLEQGAVASGFVLADATLQARVDALALRLGGTEALTAWVSAHGYTGEEFRSSLRHQVAAAWMRDKISASVPVTAEQVHVKQILLYNAGDAQQTLGYLQTGWNFNDLAAQKDPVTKGELGWFPRGYLPSKAIEEAAFSLQPGQYSVIIQDETGYHILYLVEKDPVHLLSPDALLTLQKHAVQDWLTRRRNESTILFVP